MLISTRSRYGLRALVRLAGIQGDTNVSLASIAEEEDIPIRYLEQIFLRFRNSGIVKGIRGPGGGYSLAIPPHEISLLSVVSLLENEFLPTNCLLPGIPEEACDNKDCDKVHTCRTRTLWARLQSMIIGFLERHTLADLALGRLENREE